METMDRACMEQKGFTHFFPPLTTRLLPHRSRWSPLENAAGGASQDTPFARASVWVFQ